MRDGSGSSGESTRPSSAVCRRLFTRTQGSFCSALLLRGKDADLDLSGIEKVSSLG